MIRRTPVKVPLPVLCSLILLVSFNQSTYSDDIQTDGEVCGNPSAPCQSRDWTFQPNEISFRLPQNLKWLNNYRSLSFYAVILKSRQATEDPDGPAGEAECSGYFSEAERQAVQAMFPHNKVFASRFGCGSPGVGYTNVNFKYNFLAVYAGESKTAAANFLNKVKASGKFPGANTRQMQVVLDYGD